MLSRNCKLFTNLLSYLFVYLFTFSHTYLLVTFLTYWFTHLFTYWFRQLFMSNVFLLTCLLSHIRPYRCIYSHIYFLSYLLTPLFLLTDLFTHFYICLLTCLLTQRTLNYHRFCKMVRSNDAWAALVFLINIVVFRAILCFLPQVRITAGLNPDHRLSSTGERSVRCTLPNLLHIYRIPSIIDLRDQRSAS